MGLDIYAYRVKKSLADKYELTLESDYSEIKSALDKEYKKSFKRSTRNYLKGLRNKHEELSPCEYAKTYLNFVLKLQKRVAWYNCYQFELMQLGYDYYSNVLKTIKTPDEVKEVFEKDAKNCYAIENAYFRKVNFIYEFFRNEMKDESCVVSKSRIKVLIDTCKNVLNNNGDEDYAKEALPTTDGFFFGSTEYDEWYWKDVKNCLQQMTKLYKSMGDEDFVFWVFSW